MSPIAAAPPVLLSCALLLAGCGSGAGHVTSPSAPAGASSSRFAAYARAVNLRPGDLPGVEPNSAEHEEREAGSQNTVARCIGAPDLAHRILRIRSPTVGNPNGLSAASSVSIDLLAPSDPKAFAARRSLAERLYRTSRAASCNAETLRAKLGGQGLQNQRVLALANPLNGVGGTIGYRVGVSGVLSGKAIRLWIDVFLIFAGHATIELEVSNLPTPAPMAGEQRLVELLRERAAAHSF